jgi:hypothetical protein
MHTTHWLNSLKSVNTAGVDGDMASLVDLDYPFLTEIQVCGHVAQLSAHLGRLEKELRRAVIGYSLYTRQLDCIQDRVSKTFCSTQCDRPPVGCCNAKHCDIFTLSDYMLYQPSSLSMQLAQAIGSLQQREDEYTMTDDMRRDTRYCPYLTDQGCTLRLFKSPRCIHYICSSVKDDLAMRFEQGGETFASAMTETSARTLSCCADFTNAQVLAAASIMLDLT